jgi:hypothetical protein
VDLNQLYFDHQITLMRASAASNLCVRAGFQDEAAGIAARIERDLRMRGAAAAGGWEARYRSDDQPTPWLPTTARRFQ